MNVFMRSALIGCLLGTVVGVDGGQGKRHRHQ